MRLKGLGSRAYNVMHHAHTVTGMMISLVLFVIFFAGAYTLFRAEIDQWANPAARTEMPQNFDYDRAIENLTASYELDMHDPVRIYPPRTGHPDVELYASVKNEGGTHDHIHGHVDQASYQIELEDEEAGPKTTVGQTLYYLHFLYQIPVLGAYISGFAALFFLLATVTGVLIHWRNIFQKFYAFFVGKRWKQIWTDAHTVIGVISLPFQVMYAITGALFCLSIFLLLPSVMVMFGGDQAPVLSTIQPPYGIESNEEAPTDPALSVNELTSNVKQDFPDHSISRITLSNYGHKGAIASFYLDDETGLMGSGSVAYGMTDGTLIKEHSHIPYDKSYGQSVYAVLVKLHYATYGNWVLKVIYFLLAMLTCFMIISGILIWQTARDRSRYSEKQKRFHHRITKLNLTVCMGLFPAVAILFITNKLVPMDYEGRGILVEQIFFIAWLVLAAIGWKWDNYGRMNRNYFLLGGALSFLIPLLNGVVTGDWIWQSWRTLPAVAGIDILWLLTGCLAIWTATKITVHEDTVDEQEAESKAKLQRSVV
ncbi:PepSY-associated TM helix domain-containing protein [Fodinibius salsisoli]|uniref:PepSY domain-containing protein n=1 Tax=Fodinibius salsisoli TaxID=2820877 RepID=A0ABT3PI63_9BACT|nr:PepSY-associated TM helix domain-containing protein [Fodinibius salsisoli]MCW9705443.1 PepSY domain-containing protein [Fodinibius salsisoli]